MPAVRLPKFPLGTHIVGDSLPICGPAGGGEHVIDALGKEPSDIDGVGRGEVELRPECPVLEGFLDQALAVIEASFYFQGVHVPAQGRQLLFLQLAYPAGRVEDHHVDVGPAVKGVRDRASRVAGGGNEDLDAPVVFAEEVFHDCGQELGAEVLEGAGGPVEQLQQEEARVEAPQNRSERECALGDPSRARSVELRGHEGGAHCRGDIRKGYGVIEAREEGSEVRGLRRVIQTAVRSEAGEQSLAEAHALLRVRPGGKPHDADSSP